MKFKNVCLFASILFTLPIHSTNLLDFSNSELDAIALKHGTDKATEWLGQERNSHDYASTYDFYFSPVRNNPIKFLEIGFLKGESAAMWEEYFPKAELYFMDINPHLLEEYSKNLSARCHLHVGNQEKEADLLNFIAIVGGDFDIILDDGGHTMKQQLTSFIALFPSVKSGGVYIIEDLHTSYWKTRNGYEYGGHGTQENPLAKEGSTIYFLQQLVHDINFIGAHTASASAKHCPPAIWDNLTYYQKNIKSIHFYGSLCFVFKR